MKSSLLSNTLGDLDNNLHSITIGLDANFYIGQNQCVCKRVTGNVGIKLSLATYLVSTSFIVRALHMFLSSIVLELRQGNKETRVWIGKYISIRSAW